MSIRPRHSYNFFELLLVVAIGVIVALVLYLFFQGDSRAAAGEGVRLPPVRRVGEPILEKAEEPAVPPSRLVEGNGDAVEEWKVYSDGAQQSVEGLIKAGKRLIDERNEWAREREAAKQEQGLVRQLAYEMARGRKRLWVDRDNDVAIDLLFVPPGPFKVGRTKKDLEQIARHSDPTQHESTSPQYEVNVAEGFFLGEFEVTNSQFTSFARQTLAEAAKKGTEREVKKSLRDVVSRWAAQPKNDIALASPVTDVSWDDAMEFCAWLARCNKLMPAGSGAGGVGGGVKVRLPTEIEWEYAARGRANFHFARADGTDHAIKLSLGPVVVGQSPDEQSWCGVFDLSGNVSEWCSDVWSDKIYQIRADSRKPLEYVASRVQVEKGSGDLENRVYRGGNFADGNQVYFEAATRRYLIQKNGKDTVGFRVMATLPTALLEPPAATPAGGPVTAGPTSAPVPNPAQHSTPGPAPEDAPGGSATYKAADRRAGRG